VADSVLLSGNVQEEVRGIQEFEAGTGVT